MENGFKQIPCHHIPHAYLGSLTAFEECRLYIFFPKLHDIDTRRTSLTNLELERYMNLLLKIMHKVYDSGVMEHFPSTWTDAACKASARSSEQGVRNDVREPQSQLLHYALPSDGVCQLWDELTYTLSLAGLQDLAEPQLLLNAKNMKTLFRSRQPKTLVQQFLSTWNFAIDAPHLLPQTM